MNGIETFRRAFPDREKPLVSYGIPFTESAPKHAESTFHASKVYVICSGTLAKTTDNLEKMKSALGSKFVGARVGMQSHTLWSEVLEIIADVRKCNADLLITLGAGSLTDAAKIVSFAIANDVDNADELATLPPDSPTRRSQVKEAVIPVICIPTSLSGGEYSHFAGATKDSTMRKHSFSGPEIKCPALVILDPALSATTPDRFWLSTGIRAVDHCVETMCSLQSNEDSDKEAAEGLKKLIPGLLNSKKDRSDLEARLMCQLGVIEAMSACSRGVPLGASHGIGHQLGPLGVGHGETSCILLPGVCKYNASQDANVSRQRAVVDMLWQDPYAVDLFKAQNLSKETADLADLLDVVIRALGMPRSLRSMGVAEDKLDKLAEHSLHDRWVKTNPAPLGKKEVLDILNLCLD